MRLAASARSRHSSSRLAVLVEEVLRGTRPRTLPDPVAEALTRLATAPERERLNELQRAS